jgi:MSHA biogenesis protein MshL
MVWEKQCINRLMRISGTLLLLLLTACQTMPPRGESTAQEIQRTLQESSEQLKAAETKSVVPPSAVSEALLPPLNVELSGVGQAPVERRFDITVNRATARSFFMNLVNDTPYNMVVHPSVGGKISLSMKNVTVDEVMQTVRNVYGYEYARTATGFEVLPSKLRSQVFKVDYLNVRREGVSQVRVSSGQVTNTQNNDNGENNTNQGDGTVSGSQVQTESVSNFWAELALALNAIVGSDEGRQVVINPQSGIVVVRAMPAELRAVEEYLNTTQNVIQRQVILEAKILEVELSDGFQSGINWATLAEHNSDSIVAGQFGGSSIFDTGASNLRGQSDALNPNNLAAVRSDMASAFGGMFAMSLNLGDFSGFLEFLQTQGDVHVLSSPRVSTVNNQKAVIKVGTDEFFVTDVDTQSDTSFASSATSQSIDVQLTPFFSGVALDVIPQISEAGEVTLHIHPSVSEVDERVKEISLTTTTNLSIPLAQSTIRESDSIVRARSGQVVVIGGLMQDQTKDTIASVPLLGDLPLVGGLFRHKQQVVRKSELVILLRPVVIQGDKTWANELKRSTGAFDALSKLSNDAGGEMASTESTGQ